MSNPQIKQIQDKIARLQIQLEYLLKIEELKKEQTDENSTHHSKAKD